MEIYKGVCIIVSLFFFVLFYKKIKKACFVVYIGLRRIDIFKIKHKIDRDSESNVHISHDYSSEEEIPPSPKSSNLKID